MRGRCASSSHLIMDASPIALAGLPHEYLDEYTRSCGWAGVTAIVVNAPLVGRVVQTSSERFLGAHWRGAGLCSNQHSVPGRAEGSNAMGAGFPCTLPAESRHHCGRRAGLHGLRLQRLLHHQARAARHLPGAPSPFMPAGRWGDRQTWAAGQRVSCTGCRRCGGRGAAEERGGGKRDGGWSVDPRQSAPAAKCAGDLRGAGGRLFLLPGLRPKPRHDAQVRTRHDSGRQDHQVWEPCGGTVSVSARCRRRRAPQRRNRGATGASPAAQGMRAKRGAHRTVSCARGAGSLP